LKKKSEHKRKRGGGVHRSASRGLNFGGRWNPPSRLGRDRVFAFRRALPGREGAVFLMGNARRGEITQDVDL